MSFKIEWISSPNHYNGRKGYKPEAIVNHITAGYMNGCLSWMTSVASQASSNYLVTRDGRIIQMVKDEDGAWANGGINKPNWSLLKSGTNPNYYTISIEHEGFPDDGLTEIQYQATLWLHKYLIGKWDIPADKEHIIGHYKIDSVSRSRCPGKLFPWDRLFDDLISKPKIKVNDKVIEGVLIDGRTYAPVREFGELLGFPVVYNPETKEVTVGGVLIDKLIIGNLSYAPVRYLAESLGYSVGWDNENKTVLITKEEK